MKKIFAVFGLVGASTTANHVSAQPAAPIATPTCSLEAGELAKAPNEDELLKHQADLKTQKRNLEESLANDLKALPGADVDKRKELEASIAGLKDRIELNRIALSYIQRALASYAKRQDNIADCESALRRWALVNRIAAPQGSTTDRQIALDVEAATVTEKLGSAKKANDELIDAGPSATVYTKLSLGGAQIGPDPGQTPNRQANAGADMATPQDDPCARMIDSPEATLNVGDCGSKARIRSARSYAGGDVTFPSSVLRPRGLTANLSGSSSDGTVSITYADSFKFRRAPKSLPVSTEDRVQLPWEFGYSFGVKAKDGLIFSRDDTDKSIRDNIDGKATVSAGLFFNVYEGETLKEWNARAAKLKDAAIKACRKDQAGGESKTPSTCTGQSLTNWIFDYKEDGTLLRPDLAKQADELYFRSRDDKPVWGAGIDFSVSRSNYNYLDPAVFVADPTSENQSDGDWNFAATVFAYKRVNPTSSKWDISVIPSLTYGSNFGYAEGTKPKQFCPAVTTGTPYVTGGCPSYYTAAPTRIQSWTPATEVRFLTPRVGPLPSLGISPKLSYESIEDSTTDRWRIDLPALVFVEKEAGLGVGLQYTRQWGGLADTANADGTFDEIPSEDMLKIVVTKTFSLTGN